MESQNQNQNRALLISGKEVCRILGISRKTLQRAEELGRISGVKLVTRKYYRRADVQRIFG
jgi:predicted site-specific integrase-resolvase